MTERTLVTHLTDLLAIMWAVRMDAFCDRWHLDNRVVPPLKAIAGHVADARLLRAVEHTTAAAGHFEAAMTELDKATALVETRVPPEEPVPTPDSR